MEIHTVPRKTEFSPHNVVEVLRSCKLYPTFCKGVVSLYTHLGRQLCPQIRRTLSDQTSNQQIHPAESRIRGILSKKFPSAEYIEVTDVSGGCGAMYEISVIAGEFKGFTMVKQHRLVHEALKEEIKDMHGLRIHTALPAQPS